MSTRNSKYVKALLSGMGLITIFLSLMLPVNILSSEALTYETFCNIEVTDGRIPHPIDPDGIVYDPDNNTIYFAVINDTANTPSINVYACSSNGLTLHSTLLLPNSDSTTNYDVLLYYYNSKLYMLVHPAPSSVPSTLTRSELFVYNGQGYTSVLFINNTASIDKFMISRDQVYVIGPYEAGGYGIWVGSLYDSTILVSTVMQEQFTFAGGIDVDSYGSLYMLLGNTNSTTGLSYYYIYKYSGGAVSLYRYLGDSSVVDSWVDLVVYNDVPYALGVDVTSGNSILTVGATDTFTAPYGSPGDLASSSSGVDALFVLDGNGTVSHYHFNGTDFIYQATLSPTPSYQVSFMYATLFAYDNLTGTNYVVLVQDELFDSNLNSIGTGIYSWQSGGSLNTGGSGSSSSGGGGVVAIDKYIVYGNSTHGYSVVAAYPDRFNESIVYAIAASYDYDSLGNLIPDNNGVALFEIDLAGNNVTLLFEAKYIMEPFDASFYEYNDSGRIYKYFYVVGQDILGKPSYMLLNATGDTITYDTVSFNGSSRFIEAIGFEFYNTSSNRVEYALYAVLDNSTLGMIIGYNNPPTTRFIPQYMLPSRVITEPQRIVDKAMYGYSIIAFITNDTVTGKAYGVLVQNLSTTSLANVTGNVDPYNSNYTYLSVNDVISVSEGVSAGKYYIAVGNSSGGILLSFNTSTSPANLIIEAINDTVVFMSLQLFNGSLYVAGSFYNTSSGNIDVAVLQYNASIKGLVQVAWGDVSGANDYVTSLLQVYPDYKVLGKSIASPPKLAYLYTTLVLPIPEPWILHLAVILVLAITLAYMGNGRRLW